MLQINFKLKEMDVIVPDNRLDFYVTRFLLKKLNTKHFHLKRNVPCLEKNAKCKIYYVHGSFVNKLTDCQVASVTVKYVIITRKN